MTVRYREYNTFKVGDHVLIDPRQIYPAYDEMAGRLEADFSKWKNRSYKNWQIARNVPATCLNFLRVGPDSNCYVLIDISGDQYVIDIAGISKSETPIVLLPEELFEI